MTLRSIKRRFLNRSGFSLGELCLVIGLLGLLAGLSWASFQRFSRQLAVEAAAYSLADQLSAAREKAVMLGETQKLTMKPSAHLLETRGSPTFIADGSGNSFEALFGVSGKASVSVQVKPTGEIDVRKL